MNDERTDHEILLKLENDIEWIKGWVKEHRESHFKIFVTVLAAVLMGIISLGKVIATAVIGLFVK